MKPQESHSFPTTPPSTVQTLVRRRERSPQHRRLTVVERRVVRLKERGPHVSAVIANQYPIASGISGIRLDRASGIGGCAVAKVHCQVRPRALAGNGE